MAELLNCPFCGAPEEEIMIFADPEEATDNSGPSRRVQCAGCNVEAPFYSSKAEAIAAWNTRPAAPVEGLEPVLYIREDGVNITPSHFHSIISPKRNYEALVTRSQAEAIIAAKDKRIEAFIANERELEDYQEMQLGKIEKLEADNAALTARVKELGTVNAKLCDDVVDYELKIAERDVSLQALETQLTAARKAARSAHDTLIEINPSNYDHDDVCQLNDASVEAIFLLADVLGETHGKSKEWWDKRRAALEARP